MDVNGQPMPDLDQVVRWVDRLLDLERTVHLALFDEPDASQTATLNERLRSMIEPGSGVEIDFNDTTTTRPAWRAAARDRVRPRVLMQVVRHRAPGGSAIDVAYVSSPTDEEEPNYFERWFIVAAGGVPLLARRDGTAVDEHGSELSWEPIDGRSVGRLGAVIDARQFTPPFLDRYRAHFDAVAAQVAKVRRPT